MASGFFVLPYRTPRAQRCGTAGTPTGKHSLSRGRTAAYRQTEAAPGKETIYFQKNKAQATRKQAHHKELAKRGTRALTPFPTCEKP